MNSQPRHEIASERVKKSNFLKTAKVARKREIHLEIWQIIKYKNWPLIIEGEATSHVASRVFEREYYW